MTEAHGLVDHLFRERAGQMVAWLTRIFGPAHLDLVEEVVQDALVKALQQWPHSGIPANPAGWLVQVARNRALDVVRRDRTFRGRASEIIAELMRSAGGSAGHPADGSPVQDDELRMIFMCCHPALAADARVALSLKTVGGFSVQEIACAFLTQDATIAQRLVRAKRRLRDLDVPFELPAGPALHDRLDSVLEVIYLLFNEGYAAHDGESMVRADICHEALRLARLVAGHPATAVPAAHALAALLAFQTARLPSRVDGAGDVVLLDDQDRTAWDAGLIALGFAHFERSAEGPTVSAYHLQAAIAAVHAGAAKAALTPWPLILRLYDDLVAVSPTPLARLNRIVALWRVEGADAALETLRPLEGEPALARYYLLPAVKGQLQAACGDGAAARRTLEAALSLPCSEPERRLLRRLAMGAGGAGA